MQMTRKLGLRLGRTIGVLALAVATIGSTALLETSAGAAVNNNGLQQTYTTTAAPGCRMTVGDQASDWAVGAIDVTGCYANHKITTAVYLAFSPTSPNYSWSWAVPTNVLTTYGSQSNYTAGACRSGWWYTMGYVSFDGGPWIGPMYSFVNNGRYTPKC